MADTVKTGYVPAPQVPEPVMSLEEAGALLRAEIQAHRAKLRLHDAVEAALTAKTQLAGFEKQKTATLAAIDTANAKKLEIEQGLSGKQGELDALGAKILGAQADLKALNISIGDTKKAWADEQAAWQAARAKEIAGLSAEIETQRKALADLMAQIAAVVAPYAGTGAHA